MNAAAVMEETKPLRLGQELRGSWIREIEGSLEGAESVIVAKVERVETRALNKLRDQLGPLQGSFHVVKNSLCRIAFRSRGWEELEGLFEGTCGISPVRGDMAAVCKLLVQFSKDHEGFVLRGGRMGKEFLQAKDLSALAKLPSRQVLLGQLAAVAQAPMRNLAVVLQAPIRSLALALKAVAQKKPEQTS